MQWQTTDHSYQDLLDFLIIEIFCCIFNETKSKPAKLMASQNQLLKFDQLSWGH